ncbi:MAG: TlpA family protein disulfide reductase [Pseudobdellovibrionaceae bacterium]
MKKLYAIAFAVVLALGAGLFYFWKYYGVQIKGNQVSPLALLDQMEDVGVPGFSSQTLEGQPFVLTHKEGQKIILNFWASWCEPCVEEFPSMINLVKQTNGRVRIVFVSADYTREEIDGFLKNFPDIKTDGISVIWDKEGSIRKLYGVEKLPETFVIGSDGKLLRKIVGTMNWLTPESLEFFK